MFDKVKRSSGLWGHLLMSSNQFYLEMNAVKPLVDAPRDQKTFSLYKTVNFFDPLKGLEGHLCPGINILGNIYNIDPPSGTSD